MQKCTFVDVSYRTSKEINITCISTNQARYLIFWPPTLNFCLVFIPLLAIKNFFIGVLLWKNSGQVSSKSSWFLWEMLYFNVYYKQYISIHLCMSTAFHPYPPIPPPHHHHQMWVTVPSRHEKTMDCRLYPIWNILKIS